jgi:hypothetical protein
MLLRKIEQSDYDLILNLDSKVYPVSPENKINSSIIDNWYNKYPDYGMIYVDKKNKSNIVALSIIIPLEYKTWEKLIKGECFENNINIKWDSNDNNIGVHLYHIEVLNRNIVGKEFYKTMLKDLNIIAKKYNHNIIGLSGYCVTVKGNRLFKEILKCKNADDLNQDKSKKSEFIIKDKNDIKIIELPYDTDIKKINGYVSKCNMLYIKRNENIDKMYSSSVWKYIE